MRMRALVIGLVVAVGLVVTPAAHAKFGMSCSSAGARRMVGDAIPPPLVRVVVVR
jgi:hypothetical protein